MEDQFIQGWFEKATTSISLHTLNMLKADYSYSTYFSVIKSLNMRRFFSKLRLNFGILNASKKNENGDMTCKLCDMGAKEDIIHFLFICPYLMHARNIFTSKMSSWINNFGNLSNTEKLHIILNFDASQTRQSEMANTSPRHMPVIANVHPIKLENFDIFFVTSFLCALEFFYYF